MKRILQIILLVVALTVMISSCNKDDIRDNPDTFLRFSTDTLAFDTVFTTVGSVTRSFKLYNDYDQFILIDEISLRDDQTSTFRLNIDGKAGNSYTNLELAPMDSTYIFVETTVRPDEPVSISPFIIEDFVDFELYGNQQSVLLSAYGQNANYIPGDKRTGGIVSICSEFSTISFDDEKPYVIYGIMLIDSCTVYMPPGCDVYVHGGISFSGEQAFSDGIIAVSNTGKLEVDGTVDNPVTFQGDRLEEEYKEEEGQWTGILFLEGSKESYINHALIKNSIIGIRVDSMAQLDVRSTIFSNQSANAVYSYHAEHLYMENCLIEGSLSNAINFSYGGKLTMNYCTVSSFGTSAGALAVGNYRCIEPSCTEGYYFNDVDLQVTNSIFVGDSKDQILLLDRSEEDDYSYELKNCIVQVDELLDTEEFADFFDQCESCIEYSFQDTLFLNVDEEMFQLDTMSIAEQKAIPISGIEKDIIDQLRDSDQPDIGCYEFIQ